MSPLWNGTYGQAPREKITKNVFFLLAPRLASALASSSFTWPIFLGKPFLISWRSQLMSTFLLDSDEPICVPKNRTCDMKVDWQHQANREGLMCDFRLFAAVHMPFRSSKSRVVSSVLLLRFGGSSIAVPVRAIGMCGAHASNGIGFSHLRRGAKPNGMGWCRISFDDCA
jgi:hypothetical protein